MPTKSKASKKTVRSNKKVKINDEKRKLGILFATAFALVGVISILVTRAAPPVSCTRSTPAVYIQSTTAWATTGVWSTAGQARSFSLAVSNRDYGCGDSAQISLTVTAPSGFTVSPASKTLTIKATTDSYQDITITAPAGTPDGDYTITASATKVGGDGTVGNASAPFKIYSSDTTPPTAFWINPDNGGTVSAGKGKTYAYIGFSARDDHQVKSMEVYIDGQLVTSQDCINSVTYDCQASYKWSLRNVTGQHTATFKATDYFNNLSTTTNTFTVIK